MAIIKNTNSGECWQGCGQIGTLKQSWGNVNWCSHFGKKLAAPQDVKPRVTL